ncbi:hypothetical protein BN844_2903 [Pseudomonas sp. SHC52]|nr:hypothetical protein BN844_2903 [Pseudomonas sp. SHC52]
MGGPHVHATSDQVNSADPKVVHGADAGDAHLDDFSLARAGMGDLRQTPIGRHMEYRPLPQIRMIGLDGRVGIRVDVPLKAGHVLPFTVGWVKGAITRDRRGIAKGILVGLRRVGPEDCGDLLAHGMGRRCAGQ